MADIVKIAILSNEEVTRMAKKTCNLNLDEKTIYALDEAAETLGMSRSQVANQVLAATLGEASAPDVVKTMFASALAANRMQRTEETEFQPV